MQPQRTADDMQRLAKPRLQKADVMRGDVAIEIGKEREARRRAAHLRYVHEVEALAIDQRRIHRSCRGRENLVERRGLKRRAPRLTRRKRRRNNVAHAVASERRGENYRRVFEERKAMM